MERPAVFLDRDGVIIENRSDYVKSWEEVQFLPMAFEALRRLARSTHAVVLVTNQSAVGQGIISLQRATEINERIAAEVRKRGGRIDASYMCPHHRHAACSCRKPAPGMLLRAAAQLGLDVARSYVVGDGICDVGAARAVGAQAILVLSGLGAEQASRLRNEGPEDYRTVADIAAAVDHILVGERSAP